MGPKGTLRAIQAAERRQQREAQRRFRELERQTKEQAKLSALEKARLEVETYENRLDVLLSVHKDCGEILDWTGLAASLSPPCPQKISYHEQKAVQRYTVLQPQQKEPSQSMLEQARARDEQDFQNAMQVYSQQMAEWERLKNLARRIITGEHKAYTEALVEFNPFAEISDLGSSINFTIHDAKLIECALKISSKQAIPPECRTLTSSGKVSVKPMPKGRFHEIYVDYLCGCVLRVAREVFALLPINVVMVTAMTDMLDSRTGQMVEEPVLSVAMSRAAIAQLNFDQLNPSDAMENFQCRGDFKTSRKSEAFQPITPLTPADIVHSSAGETNFENLRASIQKMREELKIWIAELNPSAEPAAQTNPTL